MAHDITRWLIPIAAFGVSLLAAIRYKRQHQSHSPSNKRATSDAEVRKVTRHNTELLQEQSRMKDTIDQSTSEIAYLRSALQRYEAQSNQNQILEETVKSQAEQIARLQGELRKQGTGSGVNEKKGIKNMFQGW